MSPPEEHTGDPGLIAVYRQTLPALYAYVHRRSGGSRELAEDVVQETYMRAMRAWERGGPPKEPIAWLRTVARNLLVTHARRSAPRSLGPGEIDRLLAAPADTPAAARLVHWGLARLGAGPARLVEAFHLDGKSLKRIAAEAGLSERAVEGRLHRARQALRRELAPFVEDHES